MASIAVVLFPAEDEKSKWTKWLRNYMGGRVTIVTATLVEGAGNDDVQQLTYSQLRNTLQDQYQHVCIMAHGGDSNNFFQGMAREKVKRVANDVRSFLAALYILPRSTYRIQVCSSGRNPANDTFQENATRSGFTSIAPRALSFIGPHGAKYIDLNIWENDCSGLAKLNNLINTSSVDGNWEAFQKVFNFAIIKELWSWNEKLEKRTWNVSQAKNSVAITSQLKGDTKVKSFIQGTQENRPDNCENQWHKKDLARFHALGASQRWQLIDYSVGGNTIDYAHA